jgi:hypothetical protein
MGGIKMKKAVALGIALSLTLGLTVPLSTTTAYAAGSTATATSTKPVSYADYQTGKYWSDSMLWAVNNGVISGYTNVKNPRTGRYENLLRPFAPVTEAEFLSNLTKYFYADEVKNTKSVDPSFWASVPYQLAEKYKLPTVAKMDKRYAASRPITREKMAHILVTAHYKKPVGSGILRFMFESKLTASKTILEYAPQSELKRGQMAVFFKKYDELYNK